MGQPENACNEPYDDLDDDNQCTTIVGEEDLCPENKDVNDSDSLCDDDSLVKSRCQGPGTSTCGGRSSSRGKMKADYRTYMDICNDLWSMVSSRRDHVTSVCGALLKIKDYVRTNEISDSLTLEERLDRHLSSFASHRGPNELFTQTSADGTSGEMVNLGARTIKLIERTAVTSGRPRTVRLKPSVELVRGTKQQPKCTFCKQVSHKISSCPFVSDLQAKKVNDANIAFYLGDPDAHQVDTMPRTMLDEVKNVDWEASQVPSQAVHVVLNVVYKDPDSGMTGRNKSRDSQENIVEATFIGENGKSLEGMPKLYKVKFVRQWISRKAARNIVFTRLRPPNHKISNDYVYK